MSGKHNSSSGRTSKETAFSASILLQRLQSAAGSESGTQSSVRLLQLKSFVLCKELRDLNIDRLFFGKAGYCVPPFYQRLDLMLQDLDLGFGFFALADLVFIVHFSTVQAAFSMP